MLTANRAAACFLGALIPLSQLPTARAQVTVDVAKITCDQYLRRSVATPDNIAVWLSGYRHGLIGSTVVETEVLKGSADKFFDYCVHNRQATLMQAIDDVLGHDK